jgi:hypothetical protein
MSWSRGKDGCVALLELQRFAGYEIVARMTNTNGVKP